MLVTSNVRATVRTLRCLRRVPKEGYSFVVRNVSSDVASERLLGYDICVFL